MPCVLQYIYAPLRALTAGTWRFENRTIKSLNKHVACKRYSSWKENGVLRTSCIRSRWPFREYNKFCLEFLNLGSNVRATYRDWACPLQWAVKSKTWEWNQVSLCTKPVMTCPLFTAWSALCIGTGRLTCFRVAVSANVSLLSIFARLSAEIWSLRMNGGVLEIVSWYNGQHDCRKNEFLHKKNWLWSHEGYVQMKLNWSVLYCKNGREFEALVHSLTNVFHQHGFRRPSLTSWKRLLNFFRNFKS